MMHTFKSNSSGGFGSRKPGIRGFNFISIRTGLGTIVSIFILIVVMTLGNGFAGDFVPAVNVQIKNVSSVLSLHLDLYKRAVGEPLNIVVPPSSSRSITMEQFGGFGETHKLWFTCYYYYRDPYDKNKKDHSLGNCTDVRVERNSFLLTNSLKINQIEGDDATLESIYYGKVYVYGVQYLDGIWSLKGMQDDGTMLVTFTTAFGTGPNM